MKFIDWMIKCLHVIKNRNMTRLIAAKAALKNDEAYKFTIDAETMNADRVVLKGKDINWKDKFEEIKPTD